MKKTATYWTAFGYGIRILDIDYGICDYAIITFVIDGKESEHAVVVKIEYDDSGNYGFWMNGEFYDITEFIVDDIMEGDNVKNEKMKTAHVTMKNPNFIKTTNVVNGVSS